jgi:FtsP/CotA-like multicopper oxidase with cupredoxin domain
MSRINHSVLTRRALLAGAAGVIASAEWPLPTQSSVPNTQFKLVAAPGRAPIVGGPYPPTDVWSYGDRVPGPEIRVRQGEPIRIMVENQLNEDTTVHWHGVRLPNAMDGVPGLTQAPIKPGEQFVYEFTPPDAGTFWYHPHADSLQQLGRGLAGPLIVEERDTVPVDRDILWVLSDWRLRSDAQIASGFGRPMEAAMSGRVGNTGTVSEQVSCRAGERIRLRLINCALARIMALRFEGHRPVVIAIDGQPCEPHEPEGGRLVLGPAMRLDVIVDMQGELGRRYSVTDEYYQGLSYWLTHLAYDEAPPIRTHPPDAPLSLPRNSLAEPDLSSAERHELKLQGGMMGAGALMGLGGMEDIRSGASWAINGISGICDGGSAWCRP